jgi:hypothetical protein
MTVIPSGFRGAALKLTLLDISRVAASLSLSPRVVWSVATVESAGYGFIPGDGRPELLFEAHKFHSMTLTEPGSSVGRWDDSHPNISSPIWDTSLYGQGGAHQYDRLAEAMALDRDAALKSSTWGMFQILGSNYELVGYDDVDSFVAAMCASEAAHLQAFAAYCIARDLVRYLAAKDWENFKLGYNGPGGDDYAAKLAAAYADVLYPPTGVPSGTTTPPPLPPVLLPVPATPYSAPITGGKVSVADPTIGSAILSPDGQTISFMPLAVGSTTISYTVTVPVVVRALLVAAPD